MMLRSRHGNKDVVGRNRYIIQSEITLVWFRTKSVGFRNRDLFLQGSIVRCHFSFRGVYLYISHYIYFFVFYLYIFLIYDDVVIYPPGSKHYISPPKVCLSL